MAAVRTFGNSLSSTRGLYYFAGALAVVLFVLFVSIDRIYSPWSARIEWSLFWSLGIASIIILAVLPTHVFSLHVHAAVVQHVLLGCFVVSEYALDDLRSVQIASGWGAVLRLKGGKAMRFWGASLDQLRSLCTYLSEIRSNQISFEIGLSAAGIWAAEIWLNNKRNRE